jgi:hypothetical protein
LESMFSEKTERLGAILLAGRRGGG